MTEQPFPVGTLVQWYNPATKATTWGTLKSYQTVLGVPVAVVDVLNSPFPVRVPAADLRPLDQENDQ